MHWAEEHLNNALLPRLTIKRVLEQDPQFQREKYGRQPHPTYAPLVDIDIDWHFQWKTWQQNSNLLCS